VPELILEIVGMLAVPFAPEYGRSAQHGVPDLVEPAGLVALLSNPESLPVVEISGQIEIEAVASRHGAVEATAAVEFESERFHEAHREYVVDGRGLARLPITRGRRFLRSPRREPHLRLGRADQSDIEVLSAPRHPDLIRRPRWRA
jgi:hypothetical protein